MKSNLTALLLRWMPLLALALLVLAPAQAEPRHAHSARVDAATQARQPMAMDGKLGGHPHKLAPVDKPNAKDGCIGGSDCNSKCNGQQCAKAGLFGALMDLFDGHPGCAPRSSPESYGDNDVPTLDRPPKLI